MFLLIFSQFMFRKTKKNPKQNNLQYKAKHKEKITVDNPFTGTIIAMCPP